TGLGREGQVWHALWRSHRPGCDRGADCRSTKKISKLHRPPHDEDRRLWQLLAMGFHAFRSGRNTNSERRRFRHSRARKTATRYGLLRLCPKSSRYTNTSTENHEKG